MCEWGNTERLTLTIPADLSRTGESYEKPVGVDSCIAPLVRALNDIGMTTRASCCGHGRLPGSIILADGREILIAPDFETARAMCHAVATTTICGEPLEEPCESSPRS